MKCNTYSTYILFQSNKVGTLSRTIFPGRPRVFWNAYSSTQPRATNQHVGSASTRWVTALAPNETKPSKTLERLIGVKLATSISRGTPGYNETVRNYLRRHRVWGLSYSKQASVTKGRQVIKPSLWKQQQTSSPTGYPSHYRERPLSQISVSGWKR